MDDRRIHSEQADLLMKAVLTLETVEDAYCFFEDLCTIAEIQAMAQRLTVATMLRDNVKYQEIARRTGASTATISRVNRAKEYGADGYNRVLDALEKQGEL
ncbi:MAG: hypothetical protein IK127_01570 [Clostridia bacterium]|nr:hypothetical protein [Clostridia bacterium]